MLKIIGSILIIGATSLIGFKYAETFQKRSKQLKELLRCIHQLQTEIEYVHTPLPEAFCNLSKKSEAPLCEVFKVVSELLLNNEAEDVHDAVVRALKTVNGDLVLQPKDLEVLIDLSKALGESDIEGHKKSFALASSNVKTNLASAEEAAAKNVKMYRYLGVAAGCTIVIMLV